MISRQRRAWPYGSEGGSAPSGMTGAVPATEPGPPIARPGTRRIYSNAGFEVLADAVAGHAEMPFGDYLAEAVFRPLALGAELRGSPAAGVHASLDDLVRFARELLRPTLVSAET